MYSNNKNVMLFRLLARLLASSAADEVYLFAHILFQTELAAYWTTVWAH